jgi:hypothetical protein
MSVLTVFDFFIGVLSWPMFSVSETKYETEDKKTRTIVVQL